MSEEYPNGIKPIDIKALFNEKNPRLARLLPGFVYRFINRVMHIREINEILANYGTLSGIDFANAMVNHFNVSQQVFGLENVPRQGRFIFAANHPLGGFDAMLLIHNVYNTAGDVRFLVNDVLMKIPQLESIFVPINKHGGHSREVANIIHTTYSSDAQILIFPSGLASRKIKGKITDTEWKKHFIQKAVEYQRDVIPVHISGRNTNFFYRLANLRTCLGIKWNLEMFFLPSETFKHKNQKFTLTFGQPIPYNTFDKSKSQLQWANEVREVLYRLPEQLAGKNEKEAKNQF
ncbi:1-acyl-sn-glycerol-3-phosphate acyltransferase [Gaoshiqia sediminis]|uniref:1-acyl-sn-glycerol-3-phosphate acyltransferase n=1 Tax=Gaoshiqia sediminis TaxID=2986998 RepID=A0AA41Y5X7_9BACT|nr:1-acyl-sn-glycerol-3-phosphate acyltransferase [Gaoshiqia sediminis]MCW0482514.1 1-acyl-sn-glycerol-3-phosphate acyltransferase [Gaoshiqia sediminis]